MLPYYDQPTEETPLVSTPSSTTLRLESSPASEEASSTSGALQYTDGRWFYSLEDITSPTQLSSRQTLLNIGGSESGSNPQHPRPFTTFLLMLTLFTTQVSLLGGRLIHSHGAGSFGLSVLAVLGLILMAWALISWLLERRRTAG